jgi:hypothetical protein
MQLKSILAAAALVAAPAVPGLPIAGPAQATGGEWTHCVVFMPDGSRIVVAYGNTNEACVTLGRRCAGSQPFNAITFYSEAVLSGDPFRICSLTL